MTRNYVDNLYSSFSNRMYINQTFERNKLNKILNRYVKVKNYSINDNINNDKYAGYNNYINGKYGDFLLEYPSVKVRLYDKGLNYSKNRLIQSVTTDKKDIGGYYIPKQNIPINIITSKNNRRVVGII